MRRRGAIKKKIMYGLKDDISWSISAAMIRMMHGWMIIYDKDGWMIISGDHPLSSAATGAWQGFESWFWVRLHSRYLFYYDHDDVDDDCDDNDEIQSFQWCACTPATFSILIMMNISVKIDNGVSNVIDLFEMALMNWWWEDESCEAVCLHQRGTSVFL